VRIAANNGGAQALQAVLAFLAEPDAADFDNADIVRLAAHDGGAPALRAVLQHLPALQHRGCTIEQIVQAGSMRRGAASHIARLAHPGP
jgi:chemotaxis response regulator CheB